MNAVSRSEAAEAVSLALAFHRAPAKHADLLHGMAPLPDSLSVLLRLAGGARPADVSPAITALASPKDLRAAAMFFVEQVLFRHDANYYRVLGLNQGASLEQIKEHHRLLMRLFHPDRESLADESRDAHATRVNLAYNTLRDADSRSRYQASLKTQPVRPVASQGMQIRVVQRHMISRRDSFWAIHIEPLFMRYLPQWVLGGTALLSLLMVGMIYQSNPPVEVGNATLLEAALTPDGPVKPAVLPETANPLPLPAVEDAKDQAARLDEAIARFENRVAGENPVSGKSGGGNVIKADQAPAQARPVMPLPRQSTVQVQPMPASKAIQPTAAARAAVAEVVIPAMAQSAKIQSIPANNAEQKPAQAALAVTQGVAQAPVQGTPGAQQPAEPAPVRADPSALLARLAEAYERGDVQEVMSLFDESARTDAGGRPETRRDYEALFRSTDLRHLRIDDVSWSSEGELLKGQGRYRMTHMRKGESILKTQSGAVRIELIRRGRTVFITGLYMVAGRS